MMFLLNISKLFQTNHSRLTLAAGLSALLFFAGCKKLDTKDHIVFDITAVMPHDGTPIPGVKYRIVEFKRKSRWGEPFGEGTATGWEIYGVTNAQGKASGDFEGILKTNYSYTIYFDYSNLQVPEGITDYTIKGPQYAPLSRSSPLGNFFEVRVLPNMAVQFNFKNTACVDTDDTFKYKFNNADENPNFIFYEATPWLQGTILNGCADFAGGYSNRLAGHYVIKWEAVRGGVTNTGLDTFYVAPGVNDNIHIEW